MYMRGKRSARLFKALVYLCLIIVGSAFFYGKAQAITGSTNATQLSTRLIVNPPFTNYNAPLTASFTAYNSGISMSSGTMTVYLYCDTPVYLAVVGPGAPVFQYPGLPIDLRSGYTVKRTNIPVSSAVSFSNACTYSGKGLTYQPVYVIEHGGYAAWSSTTVFTNAATATATPTRTVSTTPTPLSNYGVRLYRTTNTSAVAPFTDNMGASITVPSASNPNVWVDYISGGPFGYDLCCDKNSIGSCNQTIPTVWRGGSPYPFGSVCTYTRAGTYTREVRASNYTNLNLPSGYKYATNQITITDPVTNLSANMIANPAKPTDAQNTTLSAIATTNNVTNTINYSFWWQCASTATNFANAKADCGDPTNSAIGAKFDGLPASTITKSVAHKFSAGIYHPKVIIEQGNASATKAFDLTIYNNPTIVPVIQAINNNTIVGSTRQYQLKASQSGYKIDTAWNYYIWYNCNLGLDSVADSLTSCGASMPSNYYSFINSTVNSVATNHNYSPGTYRPKVIVRRDGMEKAAYTDLVVPAIASPSPSPSPSRTPSPSPSPSRTPSPSPSPSRTPSPSPSPSRTPSPSPSPSRTPSPSPSPSVIPGRMTVALSTSPSVLLENETVNITADVTDTDPSVVGTNYTFWWHCDNPSTNVEEVMNDPNCGMPRIMGDATTDTIERRANGVQFNAVKLNGGLANQQVATKLFGSGPRTIKVIVERRTQALETRRAIVVNPQTLDVDLNISPAQADTNQSVSLNAVTTSTDSTSNYNYYFWWDCNDPSTSVSDISSSQKCGAPSDATKGAQYLSQGPTVTTKLANTRYPTGGIKHPKVIVVHGSLATSRVGEIMINKPTLIAGLSVNPTSAEGEARPATLQASAGGSATGTVNYTFWWDCDNPTTDVTAASQDSACGSPYNSEKGFKIDGQSGNTLNQTHDYTGEGVYHPKVIVERDGADPSEARTTLTITQAPEKTLYVDLSAQRIGTNFPVNMAFTTRLSGTAAGTTNYKLWWDCQPTDFDEESLMSQCGDPADSTKGMVYSSSASETTKTVNHNYTLSGLRHPVLITERDNVIDAKIAEIEIPAANNPSPTPSPSVAPSLTPSVTSTVSATPNPDSITFPAGYSVRGFNFNQSTSVFGEKGITIYSLNQSARNWDKIMPTDSGDLQANKAYYFYAPSEVSVDKPSGAASSEITITPGWNFLWNEAPSSLNSFKVTIYDSGQCIARNVPLANLKNASVIYKWIYVVENDQSLISCQVFSLLTGVDKPSTGCNESNPLLNEVASVKQNKGVWIYLFGSHIEGWADKTQFECN